MKSIFGDNIPDVPPVKPKGYFKEWKMMNLYHKSVYGNVRCGNCASFIDGQFKKCRLMGQSASTASDIRNSYVCRHFERNTDARNNR